MKTPKVRKDVAQAWRAFDEGVRCPLGGACPYCGGQEVGVAFGHYSASAAHALSVWRCPACRVDFHYHGGGRFSAVCDIPPVVG